MAVRPDQNFSEGLTLMRTVTVSAVTLGQVVKDGASDHQCQPSTDGIDATGIVMQLGSLAGAVGDKVTIAPLAGSMIVPVKVGTGGATRGKQAKVVADGVTNSVPAGAGTTATPTVGQFTQSGVAGDMVGLIPILGWQTN